MKLFKRTTIVFLILIVIALGLSFFIKGEIKDGEGRVDVDDLSGQRIGIVCAYEADYLLTGRDDVTLLRYNTQSDCLVALAYRKVDAVAIPKDTANYVLQDSSGLKINEKPIAVTGSVVCFREDNSLWKEFNEFIKYFKKTQEYKEYINRIDNLEFQDGTIMPKETGTGKVIKIGYSPEVMPIIFKDTITGKPGGYEAEIMIRFANYMNYKIDWIESTEQTAFEQALSGQIDGYCLGYTDVYRFEYTLNSELEMSDIYHDTDIVLVEIENYDNLSIGAH